MIRKVVIRRFKRFDEVSFDLPGHVVLAGPNNMGKTTLLQAVAAWGLALERWKQLNNYHRRGGAYAKAPIARQTFSAVPLRDFGLLWRDRRSRLNIEIEIHSVEGWAITMEFEANSTEQIYVRPHWNLDPGMVHAANLDTIFVPPMTGLSSDEPIYQRPKIDQLLGQAKPGEVLRNLLVAANHSEGVWEKLEASVKRLFGYRLVAPDATGAHILADYWDGQTRLDIASAGSGFQQVLMLLTFLHTRPASVLLIDEPDAHLHVILQDAIYGELRAVAAEKKSQLILATHSEVIIDSVDPTELWVMLTKPRPLGEGEGARLIRSLRVLTNTDIMLAAEAPGVLYLDGYTDLDILREWARILDHPLYKVLTTNLFWKPAVSETRPGAAGVSAKDHYDALKLVRDDLPGLQLIDGDARLEIQSTPITGRGFQRLRWKRYEIESYLVHPAAIARYVEQQVGSAAAQPHLEDLRKHFEESYPPAFLKNPFGDYPYLANTKARTDLLPPALTAAGLPAIPYTRYNEIAALMLPEEIHPEVKEKLDLIQKAFNL
jgi:ABC-type transport system involved in cytochrome c biogenesis ATPase subunit